MNDLEILDLFNKMLQNDKLILKILTGLDEINKLQWTITLFLGLGIIALFFYVIYFINQLRDIKKDIENLKLIAEILKK